MVLASELALPTLDIRSPQFAAAPLAHLREAQSRHPWLATSDMGYVVHEYQAIRDLTMLDDWVKWARGIGTPEHHEDVPTWEKYFGVSLDHKVIGIQYTITALVLISVGGLFALIFRTELAASQLQFLTTTFRLFNQNGPQIYN